MVFRTAALKNLEMFQENTSVRSLENFQEGLCDILIIIRKHIYDILLKPGKLEIEGILSAIFII